MSDICNTIAKLPPKMKRDEAFEYYGKQIRKFFGSDEEIRSHFVKVEDYFDYHEAKRILSGLRA